MLGPLLFNIFVNDSVNITSLRLYADDTTQYVANVCPVSLEFNVNQDLKSLIEWFTRTFLQVNASKTQATTLGKSQFNYEFSIDAKLIEIEPTLKILGVTLDKTLSFKPHITNMLKKAFVKIVALRRIK